jgi:hypothetical protein
MATSARTSPAALRYAHKRVIDALRTAHDVLHYILDDIPLREWNPTAPSTRHTPRSAEWVITHLTAYYDLVTRNLGGSPRQLATAYRLVHPTMFDDGPPKSPTKKSTPTKASTAAAAPMAKVRLLRHHGSAFHALIDHATTLTPADLIKSPAGSMRDYAPDRLACLERAVWHEGWHTAHLAAIRATLGLPPKF